MSLRIAMVIPVLNNFRGCVDMLETIKSQHNTKVIIMPNYIHNHCLSKAWNDGIQIGRDWGADVIGIFNDDLIFAPTTVDIMAETLVGYTSHDSAIFGPKEKVVAISGERRTDDPMIIRASERLRELPKRIGHGGDFSCFMVTPDFPEKAGKFDENFKPAYFEDNDMHHRMKKLGLIMLSTNQAAFYHYGSVTQFNVSGGVCNSEKFQANRNYYITKWGDSPGSERFETPYNNPELSLKDWILNG